MDDDKRHALEVMLKKLGVANVQEEIKKLNRDRRSNLARQNRQSSSKMGKSLRKDDQKEVIIKPKRKYTRRIKTEDVKGET